MRGRLPMFFPKKWDNSSKSHFVFVLSEKRQMATVWGVWRRCCGAGASSGARVSISQPFTVPTMMINCRLATTVTAQHHDDRRFTSAPSLSSGTRGAATEQHRDDPRSRYGGHPVTGAARRREAAATDESKSGGDVAVRINKNTNLDEDEEEDESDGAARGRRHTFTQRDKGAREGGGDDARRAPPVVAGDGLHRLSTYVTAHVANASSQTGRGWTQHKEEGAGASTRGSADSTKPTTASNRSASPQTPPLESKSTIPSGQPLPDAFQVTALLYNAQGRPVLKALPWTFTTWSELETTFPPQLRSAFQTFRGVHGLHQPTSTQIQAISAIVDGGDLLCVAPTASGKTLCFVLPILARLMAEDAALGNGGLTGGDTVREGLADAAVRDSVDPLTCKYCGLDMTKAKVCPQTAAPHPPLSALLGGRATSAAAVRNAVTGGRGAMASPRAVILCPTADLARQIHRLIVDLITTGTAAGGPSDGGGSPVLAAEGGGPRRVKAGLFFKWTDESEETFVRRSVHQCDILVGVAQQVFMGLETGRLLPGRVEVVVVDEVDDSFKLEKFEPLWKALQRMRCVGGGGGSGNGHPRSRLASPESRPQLILTGATLPDELHDFLRAKVLHADHRLITATKSLDSVTKKYSSNITHSVLLVSRDEKVTRIKQLYDDEIIGAAQRTIVFCNSKATVRWLCGELALALRRHRVCIAHITSERTLYHRTAALKMFASGVATLLVSTDLCARGLDFDEAEVVHVVNYDMPVVWENFTHRAGRCGRRVGSRGYVHSLFTPDDVRIARPLVRILASTGQVVPAALQAYANQGFLECFARRMREHPGGLPAKATTAQKQNYQLGLGARVYPVVHDTTGHHRPRS